MLRTMNLYSGMNAALRRMTELYEPIAQVNGLTVPALMGLAALYLQDGLTAYELADVTGQLRTSVTRTVAALVDEGWAKVEPDAHDPHVRRVWLTDLANEFKEAICEQLLGIEERIQWAIRNPMVQARADWAMDTIGLLNMTEDIAEIRDPFPKLIRQNLVPKEPV